MGYFPPSPGCVSPVVSAEIYLAFLHSVFLADFPYKRIIIMVNPVSDIKMENYLTVYQPI